jgi:hypothetical protein
MLLEARGLEDQSAYVIPQRYCVVTAKCEVEVETIFVAAVEAMALHKGVTVCDFLEQS